MKGTRFGRYVVTGELGRGAMGSVYRATDPLIEREVAIKTLHPNLPDEALAEVRERFIREAKSAGRLNHPNVVTIHDVGEENGVAYIAMELLEGRSLQQMLRDKDRLPFEQIGELIAQIADGLGHAHGMGIVHRDVKPANVVVSSGGRAKLTDFGVAHVASSSMTQTGSSLGSPKYMAPEQVFGQPVSARSDLFSLGVVLYEMLLRKTPFERPNDTTVFAMMHRIASEPHPPLRAADPSIPAAFEQVIDRALAKKEAERYPSAAEMAAALRAIARGGAAAAPASAAQSDTERTVALMADAVRASEATVPSVPPRAAPEAPQKPASTLKVLDAGDRFLFSGNERAEVEAGLAGYLARGARLLSAVSKVGSSWVAACGPPQTMQGDDGAKTLVLSHTPVQKRHATRTEDGECVVEKLGLKLVLSGPTHAAVKRKVEDLISRGADLEGEIEEMDGRWHALMDTGGSGQFKGRW